MVFSTPPNIVPLHALLFGEDQARYILSVPAKQAQDVMKQASNAGVPAFWIGMTGGDALQLPQELPISVSELKQAHEDWLPTYMAGQE